MVYQYSTFQQQKALGYNKQNETMQIKEIKRKKNKNLQFREEQLFVLIKNCKNWFRCRVDKDWQAAD